MQNFIMAGFIAIGLGLAGWFIGNGFIEGQQDRYVTVKGLAEQDVKADLALWSLKFVAAGNDLSAVQKQIQANEQALHHFLKQQDLADSISSQKLDVVDKAAQAYGNDNYKNRFIISKTVLIRSSDVDKVEQAAENTSALIQAGVILDSQYGSDNRPVYLFDGLNQLKPQMIAKATENARIAAQQFAKDSHSQLNGIRHASQGVFLILPRDKAPMLNADQQVLKTVRVVATIQYRLKD